MNDQLTAYIAFLQTSEDVDACLEVHERIAGIAQERDLPILTSALYSSASNFWVRELLAQVVLGIAGSKALPHLMAVLLMNTQDGYDSDTLVGYLTILAEMDPVGTLSQLEIMEKTSSGPALEDIHWLMTFCRREFSEN